MTPEREEIPAWLEQQNELRKELKEDIQCVAKDTKEAVDELWRRLDERLARMEANFVSTSHFLARTDALQRAFDAHENAWATERENIWAAIHRIDGVIRWLAAAIVTAFISLTADILLRVLSGG